MLKGVEEHLAKKIYHLRGLGATDDEIHEILLDNRPEELYQEVVYATAVAKLLAPKP